jgi:hypothetical protein
MSSADAALWWARSRAAGPLRVPSATRTPTGMLRLMERGGEHCWLLPSPPDDVTPAVLRELRIQALPVEHPNETSRVLAAALRCCWIDTQAGPWPGQPATVRDVLDVVDQLMPGRGAEVPRRAAAERGRRDPRRGGRAGDRGKDPPAWPGTSARGPSAAARQCGRSA